MTDQQPVPGPVPSPLPDNADAVSPAAGPPERAWWARRGVVVGISTLICLAVVAGGGFWGLDRLGDADRTAPTVVWGDPAVDAEGDAVDDKPVPPTGVAAMLLPVPVGYELGPDLGQYGNDSVLTARQAVAVLKEGSRGLPSAQRRKHHKAVDKLRVRGLAMRSYQSTTSDMVVETQIAQMNGKGARERADFVKKFADFLGVFRKGPKIKGHAGAKCFLLPKDSESKTDAMFCSAAQGDALISFYAYGVKPFDTKEAADLLKQQLDHLDSPGELV
ncbi:hypothetical protein [Streptomyces sp. SYSU K21746]